MAEPLVADLAEAVERAAVGDQKQPGLGLGGIDLRDGAAPGRGRVALGAQQRQRGALGAAPAVLGEGLTRAERPALACLALQFLRAGLSRVGGQRQRALELDARALHPGLRSGIDDQAQLDLRQRRAARHDRDPLAVVGGLGAHRRAEAAFGLEQRAGLGRCGLAQAHQLGARHLRGLRAGQIARQVEMALQQRAQRLGRLDLQRPGHLLGRGLGLDGGRGQQGQRSQRGRPGQRTSPSSHRPHFDSSRIACSRPATVSGNMRWPISCSIIAMLWR